jgi:hypothetical protein
MSMKALRIKREEAQTRRMIQHLANYGFFPTSISNGEDEVTAPYQQWFPISSTIDYAFATDTARIFFSSFPGGDSGSVTLVLGNDDDLISDWAWPSGDTNFNKAMKDFMAAEERREVFVAEKEEKAKKEYEDD